MQIFVSGVGAGTQTLDVCGTDSIESVKHQVECLHGIPSTHQRLIFASKQLEEGRVLSDYNIENAATLHLNLRIMGGIDFQNRAGVKFGGGECKII
jgi:hypothetical protein